MKKLNFFVVIIFVLFSGIGCFGKRHSEFNKVGSKLEHSGNYYGFTHDAGPEELANASLTNAYADQVRSGNIKTIRQKGEAIDLTKKKTNKRR